MFGDISYRNRCVVSKLQRRVREALKKLIGKDRTIAPNLSTGFPCNATRNVPGGPVNPSVDLAADLSTNLLAVNVDPKPH
jgi:hypothetical protein